MPQERLQKIIAAAGIASRRKAEELISSGRVVVNGQVVTELGAKANPDRDRITVNGQPLRMPEQRLYFMLNKPKGYVSTTSDPQGRRTVLDLVKPLLHGSTRLYPVGRLDFHSEGLLLLTNDGDFAQQMTHASHHIPKTYLVKVSGQPSEEALRKLRSGVVIGDERRPGERNRAGYKRAPLKTARTAPARITLLRNAPNPWFEVTLIEGRNRQIHRMFERVGHFVEKIKRVRFGNLTLDVETGRFRALTRGEVRSLREFAESQGQVHENK
ncbi:MAG TPA: pseudouridine synthase [Terriglobales bacterium]|nr:pseudouridine synthase [Terriglobales bacterium]